MALKIINNDVIRPQKDGGEEWLTTLHHFSPLFTLIKFEGESHIN